VTLASILAVFILITGGMIPAQASEVRAGNGAYIYHASVGNAQAIGVWCLNTNVVRWLQMGQDAPGKCPSAYGAYAWTMPQAYGVRCSSGAGGGYTYQWVPGQPDTIPWWYDNNGPNYCWSFAR